LHEFLGFGKKKEMKPEEHKFIRRQKKIEKGLKMFDVTPETEKKREMQASDELRKLKLQRGMAEDWKEGLKTLGKHMFIGHAPIQAYKARKKIGGTTGQALGSAGKSLLKHATPLGWGETYMKTKAAWKRPKGEVQEDWKEGVKTLGKSLIPGYHSYRTFKNVRARGGTKKQAFGQIAKDVGKNIITGGVHSAVQVGHRVAKDWQKGRKFPHPSMESKEDRSMVNGLYELEKGEEFAVGCPHCYEEFLLEDVDLYEDSEGQFIICPFCEEDIDLVEGEEEEKEYTMNEQIFESLLENVSQLDEEDVDGFVDNLTEEEVDQMLEFCDLIEEMDAENDMDAGELAEGLIDTILNGTDPAEIADVLAGRDE